jgi:hypothetical protein
MADVVGRVANRQHFGVGSGVAGELAFVVAGSDNNAVANDDCANGDVVVPKRK